MFFKVLVQVRVMKFNSGGEKLSKMCYLQPRRPRRNKNTFTENQTCQMSYFLWFWSKSRPLPRPLYEACLFFSAWVQDLWLPSNNK